LAELLNDLSRIGPKLRHVFHMAFIPSSAR
jgi:hypothetical protein